MPWCAKAVAATAAAFAASPIVLSRSYLCPRKPRGSDPRPLGISIAVGLIPPDVMRDLRVLAVAHDLAVFMSGTLRSHGDLAHNGAGGSLVRLAPQITWLFQQRIRLAWPR